MSKERSGVEEGGDLRLAEEWLGEVMKVQEDKEVSFLVRGIDSAGARKMGGVLADDPKRCRTQRRCSRNSEYYC